MYSRRTGETGAEKVTGSDTQPGSEILKTSVIPLVPINRTCRASWGLFSEQPHVFAIRLEGSVHFRGEVHAPIDDHADFTGRQPEAGADVGIRSTSPNLWIKNATGWIPGMIQESEFIDDEHS